MDKQSPCCIALLLALSGILWPAETRAPYLKQALVSQTRKTVHVSANAPRPLEQTLNALQEKYGWQLSYEDPRYIFKLDLAEVSDVALRLGGPTQVPRGGLFNIKFAIPSNGLPDAEKTLHQIVDAYNRSDNPGRFELRSIGEKNFDLVGVFANDKQGHLARQEVLLDLPITIPVMQRSVSDVVALICQKVSELSHITVNLGVYSRRLDHVTATIGGTEVPARTLLVNALASTGRKVYWRMFFDPGSQSYFLNLHSLKKE